MPPCDVSRGCDSVTVLPAASPDGLSEQPACGVPFPHPVSRSSPCLSRTLCSLKYQDLAGRPMEYGVGDTPQDESGDAAPCV